MSVWRLFTLRVEFTVIIKYEILEILSAGGSRPQCTRNGSNTSVFIFMIIGIAINLNKFNQRLNGITMSSRQTLNNIILWMEP